MGVLDTLSNAKPVRRGGALIMDGDLMMQWESARARLEEASTQDAKNGSLADLPATTAVVEEMEALRDRVKASEVWFEFAPMQWPEYVALQAEHPPRQDNLIDAMRGYNIETFQPVLIRRSCASVTGADGDVETEIPDELWDSLLGKPAAGDDPAVPPKLNIRQVALLTGWATEVNDGVNAVPPSARSLLGNRDSGASLAQPSPGTPPRSGSAGGSPRGSRKSSATKKAPSKGRSPAT